MFDLIARSNGALRARNWFVVLLELATVVVGIFLGLRVDAWNQARLDRAGEAAYLGRLSADLDRTLGLLREDQAELTTWFEDTRALARALDDPTGGRDSAYAHRLGFAESTRVLIGRAQLATITELVDGGRLLLISDPDVRTAIAASEGLTESRRLQLQVLSRQQQVLAELIRPYYRLVEDRDGSWGDVAFEWDEVAGNEVLIRALTQAAENVRVNGIWLDDVVVEVEALARLIEEAPGPPGESRP